MEKIETNNYNRKANESNKITFSETDTTTQTIEDCLTLKATRQHRLQQAVDSVFNAHIHILYTMVSFVTDLTKPTENIKYFENIFNVIKRIRLKTCPQAS